MPKLLIYPHLVRPLFDGVAEFWRELIGVGDDLLDIAVLIDELGGGFVANPRNTGQVVRSFAFERYEVRPLFRRHAVTLHYCRIIVTDNIRDSPPRHNDGDTVPHELEDVPVTGHDDDFIALLP